jgi:predicted transcriptional regulator
MTTKIKNENFVLIQGYMINDFKLKGNELIVYAIINGFSQEEGQVFSGSLQYLAEWTNSSKQSVINNLKSLIDKGLIGKNEKFINGVKFCEYYSKKFNGGIQKSLIPLKKVDGGIQKSLIPIQKSLMGGIQKSLPNNIDINNINNNIDNKKDIYIYSSSSSDEDILKNEFKNLWELYPKKVGREKSYCLYKKFRTSKNDYCTYDEVLTALNKYLKYIEQNSWYSPKDGSTWFNRGWKDEYQIKEEKVPSWFYESFEKKEDPQEIEELKRLINEM